MNPENMSIQTALAEIRERIERACEKAGRFATEVQLVGASKSVEISRMIEAVHAGVQNFGENKIQEALPKIEEMKKRGLSCRWHFIGKLQRNKAKFAVGRFDLIHSVNSLPLAEEISRQAGKQGLIQEILMEVNVSGEPSKEGFPGSEALSSAYRINQLKYVKLIGLMTIPPLTQNPETTRPFFRALKQLGLQMEGGTVPPCKVYSMGMSNDFEVAVEEGATHVRIGRALFGERS